MKQPIFRGSGTALVTPFFSDGAIDYASLGRLIDLQIASKTDALIPCGTTGESATMSEKERLSVIEYTVKRVAGKIPVIAGTGTNNTAQSVSLTKQAKSLGADGVLAVCPYYNKPDQRGLEKHYQALADCQIPVLVYNVPSRTGCTVSAQTLKKLSFHPYIAGLKDAGGSLQSAATVRHLCGDDLPLYSGDDGCIVPFLSIGGVGVISVVSNILPRAVHNLCQRWFSGDETGAAKIQLRLMPVISALFSKTNPIPVKAALEFLGYEPQALRLPLCPLPEEEKQDLFRVLKEWTDNDDGA
ncbi:MAG: 4-hydroxy-tetrahydrodipicolinate synthase [Clostridia bacterium]|nr:4-hydroxy-tetrahydrodipicolinate synthase [Clostridia bacterium]